MASHASSPGCHSLVFAISLTAVAGVSSRALAAEATSPTVVLGIEPLDGAPDTVAAEITDALRQRVAATKGYQLLQGKDLVEVKLVFACPDAAPACMSQAGKSLGADKLIFGNVKRAGNDYQVTLKLLDVSRAVVESFTAETVPKKHADAARPAIDARRAGSRSSVARAAVRSRCGRTSRAPPSAWTERRWGRPGSSPVVIPDVAPGPPRSDRREERLHHDQAGVHAGGRAEPAAQPDPVAGVGRGPTPGRSARASKSAAQASPRAARDRRWPGPASGSRSSAPWRRPGWR